MSAEDYRRLTYDLTLAVARQLLPRNPRMAFEYISGEGTNEFSAEVGARESRDGSGSVEAHVDSAPPVVGNDRRALVDDFLRRCNALNVAVTIRRCHIWCLAKHRTAKQFERWQSSHPKATKTDENAFGGL